MKSFFFRLIIFSIAWIFYYMLSKYTFYNDFYKKEEYTGKVVLKYQNKKKTNFIDVREQNRTDAHVIVFDSVYNYIDTGDYIIKRKDTNIYILIKVDDTIFFKNDTL